MLYAWSNGYEYSDHVVRFVRDDSGWHAESLQLMNAIGRDPDGRGGVLFIVPDRELKLFKPKTMISLVEFLDHEEFKLDSDSSDRRVLNRLPSRFLDHIQATGNEYRANFGTYIRQCIMRPPEED